MIYFVITMKKVVLVVLLVLFFIIGGMLVWNFFCCFTGQAILDDYSYTRAFCEDLVCEDYVVVCDGDEFVSKSLIEGSLVLHEEGWVDFRVDGDLC